MLRLARIDAWMRQGHPAQPHWYLYMLGVEPRAHGRGFGGALLRHLSERADRDGVPAHLETDRPENVGLYQRFGYVVTEMAQVRGFSSLPMWRMLRSSGDAGGRST
jgi:ribosomal protein S18 acetylase RimI-like enzyme